MIRIAVRLGLSALVFAPSAFADPAAPLPDPSASVVAEQRVAVAPAPTEDECNSESLLSRFDVAARVGLMSLSEPYHRGAGLLLGGEVDFQLTPAWRVGGYMQSLDDFLPGGDGVPDFSLIRFGALAQWHSIPDGVVDPWFGVSIGALHGTTFFHEGPEESRWGMDVGADLGLDFHMGRHVAVGPLVAVAVPVLDRPSSDRYPPFPTSFVYPIPLLRLAVTL